MGLCSLFLSLETPNGVTIIEYSSDQQRLLLVAHTTLMEILCNGSYSPMKYQNLIGNEIYGAYTVFFLFKAFSLEKMYSFSHDKSLGAQDHRVVSNLIPSGMVGNLAGFM